VKTLQTLSAIALKRGAKNEAWEYIAQARKLAPNSAQVVFAFAGVSLENYLVSEAIMALRLLLLREPDNPEYLLMLGNCVLESATEFSKAVDYFRRYVELRPDDALGHMMLGYGHYVNRDYDKAGAELRRTLEIQPDFLEAEYYLAMIDYHGNRDEAAVERLEALLKRRPDHHKAHTTLGKIFLRQRRFGEAVEHLQRAVELTGGTSDLHFNLSRTFTQLGDRAEAERQLALYQRFKVEEEKREQEGRRLRFQELREQQ
jgi:predicted Zn-dependent protease